MSQGIGSGLYDVGRIYLDGMDWGTASNDVSEWNCTRRLSVAATYM